jgi:hypothetical protein
MKNDSPIPMKESGKAENANESNAIELHDEGLESLYNVIQKQQARQAKKKLKKLEAQLPKLENDQQDE